MLPPGLGVDGDDRVRDSGSLKPMVDQVVGVNFVDLVTDLVDPCFLLFEDESFTGIDYSGVSHYIPKTGVGKVSLNGLGKS